MITIMLLLGVAVISFLAGVSLKEGQQGGVVSDFFIPMCCLLFGAVIYVLILYGYSMPWEGCRC